MKRILFYSLAASAVCAMALSNAEAATRKHHTTGHYASVAAKLRTVASRQLIASEPSQMSVGRSINDSWDHSCFRTVNYMCGGAGGY
jgi:hypothetical protein